MATTLSDQRLETAIDEHPVMRWGAVFAGWGVAAGMALMLYVFGLALGLSAFDPRNAAGGGFSAAAVAWTILTWGAALWTGGMFASWFDGRNDTEMGVIRGLTVWGLSMAATGLLAVSGLAHLSLMTAMPETGGQAIAPIRATHYVTTFMWAAFGSALVSLITSAFGGWVGAKHIHHVYHLRRYAKHGVGGAAR